MYKKLLTTTLLVAQIYVLFSFNSAFAARAQNIEANLTQRGYELSESGMREVLAKRNLLEVADCLRYIVQEQLVRLLPEVTACMEHFDSIESLGESSRLRFVRCLLAIDKEMSEMELEGYLARIRHQLYDVKKGDKEFRGPPISSYNALLAAHEYWDVDIFDDLVFLSSTDIMKGGAYPFTTQKLFELYGDRVSEANVNTMLTAWEDWPERKQFIQRRVREYGMRLESGREQGGNYREVESVEIR